MRTFATKRNQCQEAQTPSFQLSHQRLSTLSSRASGISQPQQTGGNQPEAEGTFSQRISSEDSAVTDFARDFTGVQLSFAGLRPAAPIQRQAVVTSPDEPCEREAENVADQVTRRGSPVTISSPT